MTLLAFLQSTSEKTIMRGDLNVYGMTWKQSHFRKREVGLKKEQNRMDCIKKMSKLKKN